MYLSCRRERSDVFHVVTLDSCPKLGMGCLINEHGMRRLIHGAISEVSTRRDVGSSNMICLSTIPNNLMPTLDERFMRWSHPNALNQRNQFAPSLHGDFSVRISRGAKSSQFVSTSAVRDDLPNENSS